MIDDILAKLEQAWNTGDGTAWAAVFASDACFVDALGRLERGRANIATSAQRVLDTIYQDSNIKFRHEADRPISERLTLVHTTSRLHVLTGPRAGDTYAAQTIVVQDRRILAFHNTIRTPYDEFLASHSA